jgi:hypothetical protein
VNALGKANTRETRATVPEPEQERPTPVIWCAQCNDWHQVPLAGRRRDQPHESCEQL